MECKFLSKRYCVNIILTIMLIVVGCAGAAGQKETVRIGTWNVEHFMKMFDQDRMPERSRNMTEYYADDEQQYEVAATIKSESFDPDILVIQECCDQEMLEYFCEKWFPNRFSYIKVFKCNSDSQMVAVVAKPGFKALSVKEYADVKDVVYNSRSGQDKNLFSRGPGFVLFQTPKGNKVWVGSTHTKSKYGNSKKVTEWRIRELEKTRDICAELIKQPDTKNLVILGDFNDDFGKDRYESSIGQDAIEVMITGKSDGKLICLDEAVWKADPKVATYHCEIKPPTYRSFIDHVFASPSMAQCVKQTVVIDESIAFAASDHLPLMSVFELPAKGGK